MHVLIVEDDLLLGQGLKTALGQKKITVDWVDKGDMVIDSLKLNQFDAIVLDLNLPKMSGMQILKEIRTLELDIPVIILTAKDTLDDKLKGLSQGADDYLTKPFAVEELIARLWAVHRRRHGIGRSNINFRHLNIDIDSQSVFVNDERITTSAKEFALLIKLIENTGRILSRTALEEALYDWDNIVESNAVEVHIHHLRKKLGKDFIKTIRGVGYVIDEK